MIDIIIGDVEVLASLVRRSVGYGNELSDEFVVHLGQSIRMFDVVMHVSSNSVVSEEIESGCCAGLWDLIKGATAWLLDGIGGKRSEGE